jgi:DNA polymerase-3 subunit gamma/tau
MVRYLRNALMAKLGGAETELLQISADERARAARTAALFTEEEITRNLQIVLRTFDDLNFRQEQRFHLELGLMKLVHAQRLLPLEEFLSGVAAGVPVKGSAPSAPARPAPSTARSTSAASSTAPTSSAAPSLSPFGGSGSWGSSPTLKQSAATAVVAAPKEPATEPAKAPMPFLVGAAVPEEAIDEAPAPAVKQEPEPAATPGEMPGVDALRGAVIQALATAGHQSASALLGAANWNLDVGNLRMEVPGLGKKMLSLTFNVAAEKIIRAELQKLGGPARFMVVPGEGGAAGAPISAAPIVGSIQEEAMNHPLVQRAKEIFDAEVRSVVDLRTK